MDYEISTKVSRSLVEKARKYGINLSELMRKAIEEEARKREIEWALTIMEEISDKARLDKPSNQLIGEFRDPKVR
ncbi:type II toxin-antitoxin system CcdA family antitoxin [Candidatus Methanodesulfokora washburnensis]|jgi:post-segregation antitoxin (ccd killing protein)|uniref:VapB-type antitoxin n=1 Tax=Candidatus Methanodesulfokora washburnensis TaxID=2478471 RepID=A0A429GPV0_9CREN|nr:type II toxin-antitoxin system CcdA family antitoxin [Candidatus Methanodesulfokores washburnensis]RSN75781.1 VapB-type antitoxin [Candidatus Methanodesulfokores washburnensis]